MKLDKMVLAKASALWTGIVWVACSAAVKFLPGLSTALMMVWTHNLDLGKYGPRSVTLAGFIWGGITLTAFAWGAGWLFGWAWEKAGGRK